MDVKMENFEIVGIENCFVCSEFMGPFKNELTEVTGYSEKRIYEILGDYFYLPQNLNLIKTFTYFRNIHGNQNI